MVPETIIEFISTISSTDRLLESPLTKFHPDERDMVIVVIGSPFNISLPEDEKFNQMFERIKGDR